MMMLGCRRQAGIRLSARMLLIVFRRRCSGLLLIMMLEGICFLSGLSGGQMLWGMSACLLIMMCGYRRSAVAWVWRLVFLFRFSMTGLILRAGITIRRSLRGALS